MWKDEAAGFLCRKGHAILKRGAQVQFIENLFKQIFKEMVFRTKIFWNWTWQCMPVISEARLTEVGVSQV